MRSSEAMAKRAEGPLTLAALSQSQIAAIRSIPAHEAAISTPIEASRPAEIFLDEARYKLEQERIFRRLPAPVMLSAMLPKPGAVLAHDGYGLPLLLMRGKDGVARAFLNACMHKGAKLVNDCELRQASRVTCPYHSWTFGLDGRLIGVAREETFLNLDKSALNLVQLPCLESGGVIWVSLDRKQTPDFSAVSEDLRADLDALGLASAHVYGRKTFELKANWKLVMEPFLENYHVRRLHARSVGPMFSDNISVTHKIGPHLRSVTGRLDFTPEALDSAPNIHKLITMAYRLFPNAVIVTSPYYISFMIIMPMTASTSQVDYYMLTRGPAADAKAQELYARSYELILNVFGKEDFWAAEISQEGLSAGAVSTLRYSGLEDKIPLYYDILESHLR